MAMQYDSADPPAIVAVVADGWPKMGGHPSFSAKADQMHETAAAAPVLVPCAWVRAPGIEGPAPSAALCEAPTSSARSAARLGVITAGQRRAFARK